jgi:hypothetical protein
MQALGTRRAALMVAAAACLAVTGCGATNANTKTIDGPVTTVNQHTVCVGGPSASGECFALDSVTKSLQVNDCVRVSYTSEDSSTPATAIKVYHLDAAKHASACRHQ